MVSLSIIRSSNSHISALAPGLVAIFVGATSGIGEITLKKFAEYAQQPRIYFIGRSQDAADRITAECKVTNPAGEYIFLRRDVSLINSVDEVCDEIMAKEKVVNLLFLSVGVPSLDRSQTPENLHLLAALNYYSRLRFITNLLPLLKHAPFLRRIVTVGGGTQEGPLDQSDFPALRVPLPDLRGHLSTLITLGLEAVARTVPEVGFVHDFPGTVKTPLTRAVLSNMSEEQLSALTFVPLEESGERHLYLATSARFPAFKKGRDGVQLEKELDVAIGTTGESGSGMYSLGFDCESASPSVQELLATLREKGMVEEIWRHTQDEFKRITQLDKEL
ncbi:hypothetical protein BP6252_06757 [Coleophoma cylindrospora]|uniref:Uncharacterized protein n=1 Tax=Coleophoma cylindrospora TaxID=1849047 RepID=A0A3D8RFW5_9HELO|nr:hypothetical protein BP6252_06757 [Coleophoma cylindrospora]